MKTSRTGLGFKLSCGALVLGLVNGATAVDVPQHHNHPSRDGLYIDAALTQVAAAGLRRDLSFKGTITGNVDAQPLYLEGAPGGKAMLVVVTESDNVSGWETSPGLICWRYGA